jgi:hypothetical protein
MPALELPLMLFLDLAVASHARGIALGASASQRVMHPTLKRRRGEA